MGDIMAATSVTGKGPGSSFGKYRPINNCGGCHCGCGNKVEPIETPRIGCYTRDKVGRRVFYTSPVAPTDIKVCS